MKKVLITLKDGYVQNIKDSFNMRLTGCPTCGLDEEYVSEIEFSIYHNDKNIIEYFELKETSYYDFHFSIGETIRLIVDNLDKFPEMTIKEFKEFMEKNLLD